MDSKAYVAKILRSTKSHTSIYTHTHTHTIDNRSYKKIIIIFSRLICYATSPEYGNAHAYLGILYITITPAQDEAYALPACNSK